MTEPFALCPNCQHLRHLPGTECETQVHHGPNRFHLCLCLARPGAALACPPQMTCQGGTFGYSDIWYLQHGHMLVSEDGEISPEVLRPDQTALRDRIADVLAAADGWTWAPGFDKTTSPSYRGYRERAAAVLAVLPPTDRAAVLREAADYAEATAEMLRGQHEFERSTGALDVMTVLRRLAAEQPTNTETVADLYGDDHSCAESGCSGEPTAEAPQPDTEAHPPHHRWYTETRDGLVDEWAPGMRFTDRVEAVERYEALKENHPLWKDGTPVERRFVRETTSYTVEEPAAPASQPAPGVLPHTMLGAAEPEEKLNLTSQPAAADTDEETRRG